MPLALSALLLSLALPTLTQFQDQTEARACVAPAPAGPPSDQFCSSPPAVSNLDISAYANGTWFQMHAFGSAATFGSLQCTTANYTLTADGTVDILNCALNAVGDSRTTCTRGKASQREGTALAAELSVFFPSLPQGTFNPGRYSVAAVLGSAEEGYTAAAVYSCQKPATDAPGLPGFNILARDPAADPEVTLAALSKELECNGYNLEGAEFTADRQKDCTYFFDEAGFDISVPRRGPPPGVDTSGGGTPPPGVVV